MSPQRTLEGRSINPKGDVSGARHLGREVA
jgi:hypothetical protein